MDTNGTRYHLLLGRTDWARCSMDPAGRLRLADLWQPTTRKADEPDLAWNPEGREIRLKALTFQFPAAPRDVAPRVDDRRGAGRDLYGNWYWIGPDSATILVRSAGDARTTGFWSAQDAVSCAPAPRYGTFGPAQPPAPPIPLELCGLAVTADRYLVAGVLRPAGLLVFDLFAGGAPRQLVFPPEIDFTPFDMAPRPGGGVWVLDRRGRRYWAFDRLFNLMPCEQSLRTLQAGGPEPFQPVDVSPADVEQVRERAPLRIPEGITLDWASPLDMNDPISIEGLPDGSVLVLDYDTALPFARIFHYRWSLQIGEVLTSEDIAEHLKPGEIGSRFLAGHDLAYVPLAQPIEEDGRKRIGRLYLASGQGNQTFAFDVFQAGEALQIDALPLYLPMRLFGGKAIVAPAATPTGNDSTSAAASVLTSAGVAAATGVYYDFDDRWLPLVEQRRPRYVAEAALYTPIERGQGVLDGKAPDCVWHRLFLDACLPPGASVSVRSRAANELAALPLAAWQTEPAPYQRSTGTELPYASPEGAYDTWELLFQAARGRYLQIELTLHGDGQTSPRIRALRAYYGRFSYLTHYLPGVYREDTLSASFLDRFLANFEGLLTGLEDRIGAAQALLDPRSAPTEALDWLAGWFGVAMDERWEPSRRRLFVRHAMAFFAARGTLNGLHMALALTFDPCPSVETFTMPLQQRERVSGIRIVEQYRTRRTPGVVLGDPTDPTGLSVAPRSGPWRPEDGVSALQQRYETFVTENGLAGRLPAAFAITAPAETTAVGPWQQFVRAALGFVPAVDEAYSSRWQAFLGRRYASIGEMNDRYRLAGNARYSAFSAVPLPADLPTDGAVLADWYQFQSVVLPMRLSAHRFVVLLPMPRTAYIDSTEQAQRLALARRVIDLEKPAHTAYDVKFYWAMFRLGEARLGYDTVVELGSRSPQFMQPMVLGQSYLVESYLASAQSAPAGRSYLAGDMR